MSLMGSSKESHVEYDSLKNQLAHVENDDSSYAEICWFLARYYDEHNQFDSMQQ